MNEFLRLSALQDQALLNYTGLACALLLGWVLCHPRLRPLYAGLLVGIYLVLSVALWMQTL